MTPSSVWFVAYHCPLSRGFGWPVYLVACRESRLRWLAQLLVSPDRQDVLLSLSCWDTVWCYTQWFCLSSIFAKRFLQNRNSFIYVFSCLLYFNDITSINMHISCPVNQQNLFSPIFRTFLSSILHPSTHFWATRSQIASFWGPTLLVCPPFSLPRSTTVNWIYFRLVLQTRFNFRSIP